MQIEWRGLHKSFGRIPVLRNMTDSIRAGEMVVLSGVSGSGKSTRKRLQCLEAHFLQVLERLHILLHVRVEIGPGWASTGMPPSLMIKGMISLAGGICSDTQVERGGLSAYA